MRNIRFKHSIVKRGNITMVMIISIVVVLTMLALCAYLVAVSKNQLRSNDKSVETANVDASVAAVSDVVETYLSNAITSLKPADAIDDSWFIPSEFIENQEESIKELVGMVLVCSNNQVNVAYVEDVPMCVHEVGTFYYNSIVITIEFANGESRNIAFYIQDSATLPVDGNVREKGDFLLTWIT